MTLSFGQVRTLSNLTDWKLKEVLKERRIKLADVLTKAKELEQQSFAQNKYLDEQKFKDLAVTVEKFQNQSEEEWKGKY